MKLITWNVNSLRARLERTLGVLDRHAPDVLALQETKCTDDQFPFQELEAAGYHAVHHGQPKYNGVALLSREPVDDVRRGFPGDPAPDMARVVGGRVGDLHLLNCYVVNGQAPGSDKFALKMRWLDALRDHLASAYDPSDRLVVVGDWNITPDDRDVHDPEKWREQIHCTEEERAQLRGFLDWGLTDLHRLHDDGPGPWTWWDYRMGAFARGWGLRIDLALGTAPVAAACTTVEVDKDERRKTTHETNPSDHAPVAVTLSS